MDTWSEAIETYRDLKPSQQTHQTAGVISILEYMKALANHDEYRWGISHFQLSISRAACATSTRRWGRRITVAGGSGESPETDLCLSEAWDQDGELHTRTEGVRTSHDKALAHFVKMLKRM